jgi:DNA polymerase-4
LTKLIHICRECLKKWDSKKILSKCNFCQSNNVYFHREFNELSIAHLDCDSFYAAVEKRDNKTLKYKPVAVGGTERGVVAAACYVARKYGIKSAMPTFKAKQLCPDLVIIKPRMEHYIKISRQIRLIMDDATPAVEPVSIDEAFLDLSGTEKLHKCIPAISMLKIQKKIYSDIGITVSVGLSYNKSMAKLASEQNKPNGFFVLGKEEAKNWLSEKPISIIFGLGKSTVKKLNSVGIHFCKDLFNFEYLKLKQILGSNTLKILKLAEGIDNRKVFKNSATKSISVETTFSKIKSEKEIKNELHLLCLKLSSRLKDKNFIGKTLTLKLKTTKFKVITRSVTSNLPLQMAHDLYSRSEELLENEIKDNVDYRLIGIGVSNFKENQDDNFQLNFEDEVKNKKNNLEFAIDEINSKIGSNKTIIGRHFNNKK